MIRKLAFILAVVLAMSLTACGSISESEIQEPSNVTTGSDSTEVQQEETETVSTEESPVSDVTIDESVLVDESGVKITAKSFDSEGVFGPEIKLLIENNSGQDLTFQCRNSSVNGYMVEPMMSVDVVNGKMANDSITFMSSDLEMCGISDIADMEFSFHIFNTESWEDYLDTGKVQLKTSIADSFEYDYDDSGDVAYEGNGVKIVIKGLVSDDSLFGPGIVTYIENTGDKDITVQTRDVSINGFMIDGLFSCDVVAGKRSVDTITFLDSDLEENSITTIEDVELSFHIFDSDSWDTVVDTEPIMIAF